MVQKHYPTGLDDRQRDHDGEIRKKRSDTLVKTLRDEYGPEFAKGYRSDTQLGTVLEREGFDSLHQFLNRKPK
ncbi:MAG: hypothetical protein KJ899_02900 [Gammaproteobacteria bacterium]|nr:hypothetical protein [Gammaproteobacteria bacterium]